MSSSVISKNFSLQYPALLPRQKSLSLNPFPTKTGFHLRVAATRPLGKKLADLYDGCISFTIFCRYNDVARFLHWGAHKFWCVPSSTATVEILFSVGPWTYCCIHKGRRKNSTILVTQLWSLIERSRSSYQPSYKSTLRFEIKLGWLLSYGFPPNIFLFH